MDQTKEVVLFLSGRPETDMSWLVSLADRLPQRYIVWSYVDIGQSLLLIKAMIVL